MHQNLEHITDFLRSRGIFERTIRMFESEKVSSMEETKCVLYQLYLIHSVQIYQGRVS